MRPLPCIDSCDVVFGEEKLAANGAGNGRMTAFFKQNTLSAREAVRLAHALQCEGELHELAQSRYDALSPVCKLLVDIAAKNAAAVTSALSAQDLKAARRADAWGRRNQEDFPILNDCAHKGKLSYLDSAATSQRCMRMLQAQADYDAHENANIYRGAYDLSIQATFSMNDARAALERFINADRRTTVFTANASASCNIVAQAAQCPCCDDEPQGEAFELYAKEALAGLPEGALKASRGCGDPVAQAQLQPGERVLDLGSGGGIDAIIAARLVGEQGHVYGLDMTLDMVELAQSNAAKAGVGNVEFLHGTIDDIPLPSNSLDAVISNCVINFCEDKRAVLQEALRVLKPGGHLVVSDIVAFSPIPAGADEGLRKVTGCTNGITLGSCYQKTLQELGYASSSIVPKTIYTLDVLQEKATRKGREEALDSARAYDIDGITGSTIITAIK